MNSIGIMAAIEDSEYRTCEGRCRRCCCAPRHTGKDGSRTRPGDSSSSTVALSTAESATYSGNSGKPYERRVVLSTAESATYSRNSVRVVVSTAENTTHLFLGISRNTQPDLLLEGR